MKLKSIEIFLVLLSIFLLCVSQLLFIPIVVFSVLFFWYFLRTRNLKLEDYLFFSFMIFSTLSIVVAKEKVFALGGVVILLLYYFFFYVGKNWEFDVRLLIGTLGISLMVLAIFGVVLYIFPDLSFVLKIGEVTLIDIPSANVFSVNSIIRSSSITPNPVIFSSSVMYILPLILIGVLKLFSSDNRVIFLLFLLVIFVGLLVLLVSSSRSFLVLFPFIVLFVLILFRRYDLLAFFFVLSIVFVIFFGSLLKGAVIERVRMIFEYQDYTSFFNRLDSYSVGLKLLKDNFLLGIGLINFRFYVPKYFGNYIHNLYLSILVEVGIFGFITFMSILVVSLYKSIKGILAGGNIIKVSFVLSIVVFLIHGLVDNTLYVVSLGSLFWLFLGMSLNDKYDSKISNTML